MPRLPTAALTELEALLGPRVTTSASDRDLHGRNETHFPPLPPEAVVYPETTAEVAALMTICAAHDVPVTAGVRAHRWKGMRWRCKAG